MNIKFVTIFTDSTGAIALSKNPAFHNGFKHIDLKYHYTCEEVANGEIQITYIPMGEMVADALTKSLDPMLHKVHCMKMGLCVDVMDWLC